MTTVLPVGPAPVCVGPAPGPARPILTARQRQVLVLAANGLTNQSIGRRLGIYEHTVKTHMQDVRRALHTNDRAQACTVALRLGLIRLDEIALPPAIALHHTGRP